MVQAEFYRGLEAAQAALRGGAGTDATRAAVCHGVADRLVASSEGAAQRACRDGCAHCCRHPVGVTLPEVAALQAAIAALPAAQRARVQARVASAAAATRDLAWADIAALPCPLLDEHQRCTVYAARPLPCRGWTSADAEACRAPGPMGIPFERAPFLRTLGVAAALRGDGPEPRELRAALAAALAAADDPGQAFSRARPAGD